LGFLSDHAADGELPKHRLYYLGLPTPFATVAAAQAAGVQTVTPSSMVGIVGGGLLTVTDMDAPAIGDTVSAALAGVGAGSVNVGAHSYEIVVNRAGGGVHTLPSAACSPVTVVNDATNGKVLATRTGGTLPVGDTWDVYRTAAGADPSVDSNFKLVNPSSLAASVLTYLDNIADASLGAVAPTTSTGSTNAEIVTVTATTLTTFTATFALAHYANWLFVAAAPLYWTDLTDFDIEWNGHTWLSMPITPGAVSAQPSGATATFKVADADGTLFPIFAAVNGGELALAAIYEAGFATSNLSAAPDDVIQIFSGLVDSAKATTDSEDTLEITLMPPTQTAAGEVPTRLLSTLVRG
jgi:hypothetical protein